jgi:glycosyltransferase involved in cell wall biosynthesis
MRIAANLGVKDEVELIESTVEHLRAIGVDIIIAYDMGSTDGTLEVLERYRSRDEFWILQLNEHTTTKEWSQALLELVWKAKVDWVAFVDADEYLLPASGSLKECEALVGADVVEVDSLNIPVGPDGPLMPGRLSPGTYGELSLYAKPMEMNAFRRHLNENPNAPFIHMQWPPKVIARPELIAAVADGCHYVTPVGGARLRSIAPGDLLIAHLPFSTRSRFARKVANIRRVYELHGEYMGQDIGWQWRRWLDLANQGRFDEEFDRNVFDRETIAALREQGMIRPARHVLRDRMRDEKIRLYGELALMQEDKIPGLNQRLTERDGQIAALNQHLIECDGQIAARERDIANLEAAVSMRDAQIAAIHASTLWRSTDPLRALSARMPPRLRRQIRLMAKACWWAATPWRMPQRLARMRDAGGEGVPHS